MQSRFCITSSFYVPKLVEHVYFEDLSSAEADDDDEMGDVVPTLVPLPPHEVTKLFTVIHVSLIITFYKEHLNCANFAPPLLL
jgi:hypothetical protein